MNIITPVSYTHLYVTGLGVVSGIGIGVSENIEALRQRKHGIGKVTLFPTALDVPVSEVKRSNEELKQLISLPPQRTVSRTALLGMIAAKEAMKDAGLTPPLRIGFISATSVGGMDLSEHFYDCLLYTSLYRLAKAGWFLLNDRMVRVNMDFNHDVNYLGMFHLEEALTNGRPGGLKVFGEWSTIYEGLSSLPSQVQKSWFGFDHYYSDCSFDEALAIVFARHPKTLLEMCIRDSVLVAHERFLCNIPSHSCGREISPFVVSLKFRRTVSS